MDHKTLKSSLLVNKKWEQIISQTSVTMKLLPLTLDGFSPANDLPTLTRNYQSVTFIGNTNWSQKMREALLKVRKGVTELHLYNCVFLENDFANLIACFPYLKRLTIVWCTLGCYLKFFPLKATMKCLEEVNVTGDAWMLGHIICKLRQLSVSQLHRGDQHVLLKFLNSQTSLKTLALQNISDLFCPRYQGEQIVLNLKFQLQELTLAQLPFVDGNHLLTLLRQAHNCENVDLGFSVIPIAFEYVLKNFHKVTSLLVDADLLPLDETFYYGLKPNTSLKHLKIHGSLASNESLLRLLSNYQKLESLDLLHFYGLCSTDSSLWDLMSELIKEVTWLRIQNCNVFNLALLKLPMLKTFYIGTLGFTNVEAWARLNTYCPNIEKLVINTAPRVWTFPSDAVFQCLKKLNHLEFTSGYAL